MRTRLDLEQLTSLTLSWSGEGCLQDVSDAIASAEMRRAVFQRQLSVFMAFDEEMLTYRPQVSFLCCRRWFSKSNILCKVAQACNNHGPW